MTPANDNNPIALTRREAAALCGLSPAGFDVWVRKGIVPTAIKGTRRWSRAAIIAALSGGSNSDPYAGMSPFERWEAENARAA